MRFRDRNLKDIADCIVGDRQYFPYRSSFYITQFLMNVIYLMYMMVVLDGGGQQKD